MSGKDDKDTKALVVQEALREGVKARIAGRAFKMKEFSEMEDRPEHYEAEILRWKTALEKTIAEKDSSIAKKHQYLWGPEDQKIKLGLPRDGVPTTKIEFAALLKAGRLGPKWRRDGPKANEADANFNDVTKEISGGTYTTWAAYHAEVQTIHKAVEQARYIIAAALNDEMQTPFMRGNYKDYNAVIEWIDQKTSCEKKIEYMADLFQKLTDAIDETNYTDTKCLNFRMALERLYIDEELEFPDWENGDRKAAILDAEAYTPALSHIFIWQIRRQFDETTWKKIEDEFRAEIGNENYNRIGWQQNKPRLWKIIDKYSKKGSKGHVKSIQQNNEHQNENPGDEIEVELEDGLVLKVQPKYNDTRQNWKKSFTKKFDLKQNGQRWQKNSRTPTNSGKSIPDANGTWVCKKCQTEGRTNKVQNNMKCKYHNLRPFYLKSIPLAKINSVDQPNQNDQKSDDFGQFNSVRTRFYGDTDSSENEN